MKRIIVIGCPGSGKSTFSKALHRNTGIPLYHLDMMYWNEDKTTVEKRVFLERLSDVLQKDEWIIDGNYASTMELRLDKCDSVFFLDLPTDVCLAGIQERRGKARSDIPWIETEDDEDFIEFIKTFKEQQKPQILKLLQKNKDKGIFIFSSREESAAFLNAMQRNAE